MYCNKWKWQCMACLFTDSPLKIYGIGNFVAGTIKSTKTITNALHGNCNGITKYR